MSWDPWGLINKQLISRHCPKKRALVTMYDHTGAMMAKCECGETYWHDHGAYGQDASARQIIRPKTIGPTIILTQ